MDTLIQRTKKVLLSVRSPIQELIQSLKHELRHATDKGRSYRPDWISRNIIDKAISYFNKFKNKLFDSGYVPKVCGSCGFSEERVTDGKMPLLIDFVDGNLNNRKLDNIRPLCYNCFFLIVGDRNSKNWYEENGIPDEETGDGEANEI